MQERVRHVESPDFMPHREPGVHYAISDLESVLAHRSEVSYKPLLAILFIGDYTPSLILTLLIWKFDEGLYAFTDLERVGLQEFLDILKEHFEELKEAPRLFTLRPKP